MYRADAGVIQSGRNGIRFFDLSVLILDNESSCSVDDTHFTQLDSSRSLAGFYTFSSGFGQYDAHTFVIQIMIDSTCCIAATAYTGNQIIGTVTSFFLFQLLFYLFADD